MPRQVLSVSFADDLLARVAEVLLEELPGADSGDLADGLVLLPSTRACRDLGHHLLDLSGRDALLLPRIATDVQWADERATALGLDDTDLPDDRIRAVLLGHGLHGATWLEGGDAAAPGLAEAFVEFFDEVRRHHVDRRVLEAEDTGPLVELARAADAETVAAEVARIREVWRLYRTVVPRDRLDRTLETMSELAAGRGLPSVRPALAVVAGFGRVDPLRARLLAAALDHGRSHRLLVPEPSAPLDCRMMATWGADEQATDPGAATRQMLARLDEAQTDVPDPRRLPPLGERLQALADEAAALQNSGPVLVLAENPEDEARAVTDRVVTWLTAHGAPDRNVTVATNDLQLAARVTAQLREAGLDADNTVGEPLAALPAGLLLRFLLRAALTDLRAEPLLEVLGHPYTRLAVGDRGTGTWALRLERMFRRETGPQSGLAGLHRRARERDAAALALFRRQGPGMDGFVAVVAEAFAPLLACADGRARAWTDLLDALEAVWEAVAPERPLGEHKDQPDLTAAARLLAGLRGNAAVLPPVSLAAFAADLGRLLAGESVVPHRPRTIPILVTGLVEARLARSDLLVLAGLNDGVFPTTASTPVVLPGRVRRQLDLPTWRESRARDAELFLRLLHGAPEVVVTWSRRRDGQPALPSPLVERLQLALAGRKPVAADAVSWRRVDPPIAGITRDQTAFAAEPVAVPRHADGRSLIRLSWSMLRVWRDCPYRALLERGYALRADEEVRDEFGRREYGRVVHAVMCDALAPDHPVFAALAAGDPAAARAALAEAGRDHFLPGADVLPERCLWYDAFVRLVPGIVAVEAARFPTWRPVAREARFTLPLTALHAWCEADDPLPTHAGEVVFTGSIDRIDRRHENGALAVIDYKTGKLPPFKAVTTGEDLQLALYAAAVEIGVVEGIDPGVEAGYFYGLEAKTLGPSLQRGGKAPLTREDDLLRDSARALVDLAVQASSPAADFPLLPRFLSGEVSGALPCRWCEYRGVCRVEERPLTPAVVVQLDKIVNHKEVVR